MQQPRHQPPTQKTLFPPCAQLTMILPRIRTKYLQGSILLPNLLSTQHVNFVHADYHDLLGSKDPHIAPESMGFIFSCLPNRNWNSPNTMTRASSAMTGNGSRRTGPARKSKASIWTARLKPRIGCARRGLKMCRR